MNNLQWLMNLYNNIIREHGKVDIYIYTLDNPGWVVKVLSDWILTIDSRKFQDIERVMNDDEWHFLKLESNLFDGSGDSKKLNFILDHLRNWVDSKSTDAEIFSPNLFNRNDSSMDIVDWLIKWFSKNCDGCWEHILGIIIEGRSDNKGWSVAIDLDLTELEEKAFEAINYKHDENNWISCYTDYDNIGRKFIGFGDAEKLVEIMNIFKTWAETA